MSARTPAWRCLRYRSDGHEEDDVQEELKGDVMSNLALSTSAATAPRHAAAVTSVVPDRASVTVWISVMAAMIGAFMAILNIQITNASLLNIEGGIGTGVDNGSWRRRKKYRCRMKKMIRAIEKVD